jgi:hypothetical protein
MSGYVAILVDGVGRQRRMMLPHLPTEYRFARFERLALTSPEMPPSVCRPADHRFELLYKRGRVGVYGFHFSDGDQFTVWRIGVTWTSELRGDAVLYVLDKQDRHVDQFLSSECIGPALTLFEFIWCDLMTLHSHREIVGIARRRQ